MKRFSSALLLALSALTMGLSQPVLAQAQDATATKNKLELAENAPDSYTVVKTDTLWGIAGKFLKSPWRWPEVWKLNTEQIKNPHWIYPGQVIYLDRNGANGPTLSLTPPGSQGGSFERLSPKIYSSPSTGAISSLPLQYLQTLLIEPLVTESENPAEAGTVIGIMENRVVIGQYGTIFARGLTPGQDDWTIYRPGKPIKDPVNKEVLGYEALMVGNARVTTPEAGAVAAAMQVGKVKMEVYAGDRLLPAAKESAFAATPRQAPSNLDARVASISGGLTETGRYGVITINAGRDKGVEAGQVVALNRYRGEASYRGPEGRDRVQTIPLPNERYGVGMVFRVFNHLSYVLVLDSSAPVVVGDSAIAP